MLSKVWLEESLPIVWWSPRTLSPTVIIAENFKSDIGQAESVDDGGQFHYNQLHSLREQ